jgi:hypothetical protein
VERSKGENRYNSKACEKEDDERARRTQHKPHQTMPSYDPPRDKRLEQDTFSLNMEK